MDKSEIIERLKNIAEHAVHTVGEEPFVMSLDDGIAVHEAIELLENLPPVQPKHGKWLPDNNNPYEMRFVCSQCKTSERVPTMMYEPIWDYCPHCGADMKCSENPNS